MLWPAEPADIMDIIRTVAIERRQTLRADLTADMSDGWLLVVPRIGTVVEAGQPDLALFVEVRFVNPRA